MSTDTLRQTLAEHADAVHDTGVAERLAGVHHRIGVARRRRRATVAAAVAVVLAAAVTAVPLVGDRAPAPVDVPKPPAKLVGWRIPAVETAAMTDYRYQDRRVSQPGERTLAWDLPAADRARMLVWATSESTGGASVLTVDGMRVGSSDGPGLTEGHLLAPGTPHQVLLTLRDPGTSDRMGLAVYERTGTPPEGVSDGLVTFRREIARDRLLTAAFGDPGQTSVEIEATVPSQRLRIADVCYGADDRAMVQIAVDGHPLGGSGCSPGTDGDPGTGGAFFDDGDENLEKWGIHAGDTVRITATLEPLREERPVGDTSRVVVGVALYALGPSAGHVARWDVPQYTEGDRGTLWEYVDSRESRPGERRLVWRLPASDDVREVSFTASQVAGDVQIVVDGEPGSRFTASPGSAGGGTRLKAGEPHVVELVQRGSGENPRALLGLVLRTPVED